VGVGDAEMAVGEGVVVAPSTDDEVGVAAIPQPDSARRTTPHEIGRIILG